MAPEVVAAEDELWFEVGLGAISVASVEEEEELASTLRGFICTITLGAGALELSRPLRSLRLVWPKP